MRKLNLFFVAHLIAAAALIAIVAVTIVRESHAREHKWHTGATGSDPLARTLLRCRDLSLKAKDDEACEAAWAESRRRFFEQDSKLRPVPQHQDLPRP